MIAAYIRVSTSAQDESLQRQAIERWAQAHGEAITVYLDKFSGKTMDRPGWKALENDLRAGRVEKLVVWKLDRLGRTAAGLTALFRELLDRQATLISLTESFDLASPMGKLLAHILASVAEYETELRAERVRAGIAAAHSNGKTWGGSKAGRTTVRVSALAESVKALASQGVPLARIARQLGISRPTVVKLAR